MNVRGHTRINFINMNSDVFMISERGQGGQANSPISVPCYRVVAQQVMYETNLIPKPRGP